MVGLCTKMMTCFMLENSGREWNLTHQVSNHEAERHSDQGGQRELEQLLRVKVAQCEGQENDDRDMDDINGKGVLRQETTEPGLTVEEVAEGGDQAQAHPNREGAVPERVGR